jgi:hypothetical protein
MENSQGYFMSMNFRLKIGLLTALMGCAGYVGAQTSPIVSQPAAGGALLTSDALDQILKPIALYPDPLLAEVFTAATLPSQIVLADRYIAQGGDVNAAALEPWDSSVQALVHYPTVLKWLDDNLAWTTDVGQAFLNQQQDVMNSIQRLRSQAQDEGNLQSTPQENVVADAGIVEIEPTDPAVIYVPSYPWDTIYDDPGIYCTFGIGFPIGPWLGCDWDWRNHHVIAWGAGHPRPGDWWRRTPGNRQAPQGVPIWHPASRVAASASRGADRGFSAATYGAARVHTPATPAPQEGLQARAGIAPRAGVAAASRGMIVGGARPEVAPREVAPAAVSRPAIESRPAAQTRPPVETRPAPQVREQPSVSAFGGPESSFEARQSSARGVESRSTMSAPSSGSARKR